ncbi:hypothetical protein BKI52_02165 [marine bacterium AO1-C]|nr:hypothetical protein BKI52_02165 [marine bacterium AO1-C]
MKTILITGATDGLGKALAFELASRNYALILHGRSPEKGEKLLSELLTKMPNAELIYYNADFESIDQIKHLASQVMKNHQELHGLINNAGLGFEPKRTESVDGYEKVFQVNYLSTYILSQVLRPLLEKTTRAHIINVSSGLHQAIDFADPQITLEWSAMRAYSQSKLAQVTYTLAMAKILDPILVRINALHPATAMPTKIVMNHFEPQSDLKDGVNSIVHLVESNDQAIHGKFFAETTEARPNAQAEDEKAQQQLMELSRQLTGV